MKNARWIWPCVLLVLALNIANAVTATPIVAGSPHEVRVGRNVEIAGEGFPDRQVVEPAIAVDPRNPDIVVAGAQDLRLVAQGAHRWSGYYRSIDGGLTWSSSLLPGFPGDTSPQGLASPLRYFTGSGDDEVSFDRTGNLYYSGLVANHTDSGFVIGNSRTAFVARFANDGADFAGATVLWQADYPKIAVDTSGGPNDGNVYLTFLGVPDQGPAFTRSTDGGLSFSKPIPIPGGGLAIALTVDAVGNVYVASIHCTGNSLHCTSGASATIRVAISSDGGLTFGRSVVAAAIKPDFSPLPGNGFNSITNPQITADASGVYIVWDDSGTGDANVLFTRSTDGGLSWSSPLTVNDLTEGQQFFPAIAVSGGIVSVAWYDGRLGQLSNGTITSLDVFYAESRDSGSSFSKSFRVTTVSFDPNLVKSSDAFIIFQPFIGDYISIAASPTAVHPIWSDNRNACDTVDPTFGCVDQDAYTAVVTP